MHNYSSLKISLSIEKFGDYSFDTERKLREAKGLNHKGHEGTQSRSGNSVIGNAFTNEEK
jgi:hypothetical protein